MMVILPLLQSGGSFPAAIDSGDTTWLLVSTALVMIMTPALGFFYAGMVRAKNVLGTIMHSFVVLALISVQWVLWGYTLAFSPDLGNLGIIGGLDWLGLNHVGGEPGIYAQTVPHLAFMMFQGMFAVITPALITGAFAERLKFSTFIVFVLLWATLVYDPVAHWVWGGGWLSKLGALDFAGGAVVHISSGVAALSAALLIGPRLGFRREPMEPHNVTMTILGAALLWLGWFGFNAGSALTAGADAATAFVATNTSAGAATLTWMFMSWKFSHSPSALGIASGAVAGLATITPAAGYVTPLSAVLIGASAGVLCFLAARWRSQSGPDDSLDVWAVHGVGGTWGILAVGLFATAKFGGFFATGSYAQLLNQFIAVAAVWVYSFVVTFLILKALDVTMGLRVDDESERQGLDLSQHGEPAYVIET